MAEDSTKGLALAILGVVALVAVVGLLLVFWNAKSTGKSTALDATWAGEDQRRVDELPRSQEWAQHTERVYGAANSREPLIEAPSYYYELPEQPRQPPSRS